MNAKSFANIQRIDINSSDYPIRLREIPDPPGQLYCAGDISLLQSDSVAVVGSRKYTIYGKNVALMLGKRLAECGVPVVSGLAYGIDGFAHEGAVEAGGKIIGVLGSGINRMSPRKNFNLMMKGYSQGGLILSEYEPEEEARSYTFPRRNRIISGLSKAVVVVEASLNSGSLITAQHAAEQGRTVYAVPGNINSQFSIGSNLLIRDGAVPLVIIDEVVRGIGIDPEEIRKALPDLGEDELKIYESLSRRQGATADMIAADCGMSTALVNSIITVMEIKGLTESFAGKIYLAK